MTDAPADPNPIETAAGALKRDVFLLNGPIGRGPDLRVVETIGATKRSDEATLILVTNGGDADAAFKISRYLQNQYKRHTILIPGFCKSAGTLMALGANELAFTPYGELGPLDIQMSKIDKLGHAESGLVISDSLNTLESRAMEVFSRTTADLLTSNQGMISFPAASQAAVDAMRAIYTPILARIDPEEIGVRSRAMRIAQDYGLRLSVKSQNLKINTLALLAETYSSHSFVIDQTEAESLFHHVRAATDAEKKIVALLGSNARFPVPQIAFHALHVVTAKEPSEVDDAEGIRQDAPPADGGHSARPTEASGAIAAFESDVVRPVDFGNAFGRDAQR